jgi:aminomethyltransferase
VVNAGNREKISSWIQSRLDDSKQTTFTDQTLDTAMIAIQGPRAVEIADAIMEMPLADLPYYNGKSTVVNGAPALVSRTGYTGEDGCEIIVTAEHATAVWQKLMDVGKDHGISPAGLGARDTLRLEAAMPLYGHELTESIDPYQAGLGFAVHLKNRDFPGHAALTEIKSAGPKLVRVGLQMDGKRVPREHYPVLLDDQPVGEVTSGTFSPTFQRPIAMAYVPPNLADEGTELQIDIRGRHHAATVVKLPFYERHPAEG